MHRHQVGGILPPLDHAAGRGILAANRNTKEDFAAAANTLSNEHYFFNARTATRDSIESLRQSIMSGTEEVICLMRKPNAREYSCSLKITVKLSTYHALQKPRPTASCSKSTGA